MSAEPIRGSNIGWEGQPSQPASPPGSPHETLILSNVSYGSSATKLCISNFQDRGIGYGEANGKAKFVVYPFE